MSTFGLEFSGSVNPNLTWKTVSKGRSTLRSSRKPSNNSNMVHDQNKSPKRVKSQCSEPGKTTGTVRRFNDNLGHMPIKKRRFPFRSPSPPPQSPCDESRELKSSKRISDQPTTTLPQRVEINFSNVETLGTDGKNKKTRGEVFGCGQDFSGIEILAEAACIHMLDEPSANTISSAIDESVATQQKSSLEIRSKVEDSFSKCVGATCRASEGAKTSSASRDDRFHWDLNTPVDEWDCSLDDTVSSVTKPGTISADCSVNMGPSNMQTIGPSTQPGITGVKAGKVPLDVIHVTDNVSGTGLAQMKSWDAGKPGVLNTGEALLEPVQNDLGLQSEVQEHGDVPSSCFKSDVDNHLDVSSVRVVDKVETTDCCLDLESYGSKKSFSEGKSIEAVSDLHDVTMESSRSTIQGDNSGTSELDLLLKTVPAEASCGLDLSSCEAVDNSAKTMESDVEKEDLQERRCHPFRCSPIACEKQELALSHLGTYEDTILGKKLNNVPRLKDAEGPGEMPELNEVETVVRSACDQPSEASQPDAKSGSPGALESEHMCDIHNYRCEDMAEPEKRYDLDGSRLEGGSDSYLEDGELRESEHCLVDNDGENREGGHVDHDSDSRDGDESTDAAGGPVAEKVVAGLVCEKRGYQLNEQLQHENGLPDAEKNMEEQNFCLRQTTISAEGDADVGCLKANPSTSMSTPRHSSTDNPEVVDMDLDEGRRSGIVSDAVKEGENGGLEDTRDVQIKGVGMKHFRRGLQSRVEGLSDRRVTDTAAPRSRYSNMNHSYYRDQGPIGVDGSLGRSRFLNTDYGEHPGSRYWNHGSRNVANPANEGDGEKFYGPSNDTSRGAHRQGMFPTSSGGHIHNVRTRSPARRDEEIGMGIMKTRDISSDSSQRNSRYDRNVSGISRGGYNRTIRETTNPSNSMPNHFIRREHSFSSGGSRIGPHHPRRSRSRSRTRSPDPRHDGRMGRGRMQYQTAGYFRERRSPVSVFCSGQRFETTSGRLRSENCRPVTRPGRFLGLSPSSRTNDYETDDEYKRLTYLPRNQRSRSRSCTPEFRSQGRMGTMKLPYPPSNDTGDHMADRRSPPRMFSTGKRFDDMGSPRRLGSDDYVRPITRPVRFQGAAQSSSRGNEYEGDDYRRKSRTIFDRIHPKRNYNVEDNDRPFDYDSKDRAAPQSFRRGGGYGREGDRRPVGAAPGGREERNNARYNSGGIYPTAPKPFRTREYSDDAPPGHQTLE